MESVAMMHYAWVCYKLQLLVCLRLLKKSLFVVTFEKRGEVIREYRTVWNSTGAMRTQISEVRRDVE